MKVLVLGGEGMLGHKVFQVLEPRFELYATFGDAPGLWQAFPQYIAAPPDRLIGGVDVLRFETVEAALDEVRPDAVVNCVGIIKQLKEASDAVLTITLNALLPHQLADACAARGARLVHISTDCVFSGRRGMYTEDDLPDPPDLYGRSKLLGEVDRAGCLTIRTSIIGRDFLKQDALLEWFLQQPRRPGARASANAIYSGLPTQVLARLIGDVLSEQPTLSGLLHVASAPDQQVRSARDAQGGHGAGHRDRARTTTSPATAA